MIELQYNILEMEEWSILMAGNSKKDSLLMPMCCIQETGGRFGKLYIFEEFSK